jgi:ureidoacrylate peracid hydrolase
MTKLTDLGNIALLVVDIQNDFCHEEGVFAESGLDISDVQEAAQRIKKFIDQVREYGVRIVYTKQIESDDITPDNLKRQFENGKLVPVCAPDSWGSELYELEPAQGEYLSEKHTYDAFSNPGLNILLKNADTVIIAGVNTDVCIDTTVRRAFTEGYQILVAEDLVATATGADEKTQKHFLALFDKFYGDVIESEKIIEYLKDHKS